MMNVSFKIRNDKFGILLVLFLFVANSLNLLFSKSIFSSPLENENTEELKLKIQEDNYLPESHYIIGPGDVLELKLFDAPEFSGDYKVLNDGSVNLPLIGSISVQHLTLDKSSKLIQNEYSKQLLRPELYLTVKVARPINVSVIGEVTRPGLYSLTANEKTNLEETNSITNSGLPKVVDAIQKAGGITQAANLKTVIIKRRLPGIKNKYKKASLDLLDLIFNGDHSQNLFLFDGDIIQILKADQISYEPIEIAQVNLSPKIININVIGQVNNPGRMKVMANTPLVQAVLLAGGPIEWKANQGNIELIRINRNGSITKKKYRINLSEGVSLANNPPLKEQDIVNVNSSSLQKITTGLGAIAAPITPLVSGLSLLKLLSD